MRQTDILDAIRDILVGAAIDASPENYDICHRFVTRSDPVVCEAFKAALGSSNKIDARLFGEIREQTASRRDAVLDRQAGKLEEQLALVMGATKDALGHTASYSQSLSAESDKLDAIGGSGDGIAAIVATLLAETKAMAERSQSLEASLANAGSELTGLREELAKAKREGDTDALTALPNRRSFDSQFAEAVTRAESGDGPLSLAFFDIDHFKAFNDTWGHQLGDHVLRFVGSQMAAQFKDIGVAARYGGEEFVLLLPGYASVDALQAVKTFCGAVSSRVLRVRSDGREIGKVTLSAGVATLRRGEKTDDLVARADGAMYAAKQAGRNRVLSA